MKKLVLLVSIFTSASVAVAQPGQGAVAPTGPQNGRMTPAEKFAKLDTCVRRRIVTTRIGPS